MVAKWSFVLEWEFHLDLKTMQYKLILKLLVWEQNVFSVSCKQIIQRNVWRWNEIRPEWKPGDSGIMWIVSRVWARPCQFCANPTLQLKLSLKKTAKRTVCSLLNLGKKTWKEAHTKRFISVQKLQAKTEHGKFQSCSTEHIRLMLNRAWWTRLAIVNVSYWKRVRTLESFFAPNQSQSESEKNDTETVY